MIDLLAAPPEPDSAVRFRSDRRARILVLKWDTFRSGVIRALAAEAYPFAQIIVAHSGADALKQLRDEPACLGLFGLTLPDVDGLDVIRAAFKERLVARLLVVSGRRDEHSRATLRALEIHGFYDYASENETTLLPAIRRVGEGKTYFSPTWQKFDLGDRKPSLSALLTNAELQAFAIMGDGSNDQAVAARLGLSDHTVRTHRESIMRKLNLHARAELMLEAQYRGVVRIAGKRVLRPGFDERLTARESGGVPLRAGTVRPLASPRL